MHTPPVSPQPTADITDVDIVDLNQYREEFCRLALEKGLCKEADLERAFAANIYSPTFFVYITEAFRAKKGKYSVGDSFWSFFVATEYGSRSRADVDLGVQCLKATRHLLADEGTYNACWNILKNVLYKKDLQRDIPGLVAEIESTYSIFRKALGPSEYWNDHHYFNHAVIAKHSREPQRDMTLLAKYRLAYAADPEALRAYYAEGHHYICHADYWGRGSTDLSKNPLPSPEELQLRSRIAKLEKYPSFAEQDRIVDTMMRIPDAPLRIQTFHLFFLFLSKDVSLRTFEDLLQSLVHQDCEATPVDKEHAHLLSGCLTIISGLDKGELVVAMSIFANMLELDQEHMLPLIPLFEQEKFEELEQMLYRMRLQEHAAKYPEKPLDEVRTAFLTREFEDSEVPDEALLDDAIHIYEDILEQGRGLLGHSDGEIKRQLEELCVPFQAVKKKKRKEQTDAKDVGIFTKKFAKLIHVNGSFVEFPESAETPKAESPMQEPVLDLAFKVRFFALLRELFKREFGVYPYNTQLLAILLMTGEQDDGIRGVYQQIKTGEGKSLILALTSAYLAIQGRRVDVITSNPYLAKRDAMKFTKFYGQLDISTDAFSIHGSEAALDSNPNIVYTTNADMIFAYLSCQLNSKPFFHNDRFDVAVVDEADNLCIDLSEQSCRIAKEAPSIFSEETLRGMLTFADSHQKNIYTDLPGTIADFQKEFPGTAEIHPIYIGLYLRSALHSNNVIQDEDYVIRDEKVIIIDVHHTGRVQEKTHWGQGLHEFVTLRNNLKLQPHFGVSAQMNHPSFIRKYANIHCISGTFGDAVDREEISDVYGMRGFDVPSHHHSKRKDETISIVPASTEFFARLEQKIRMYHELKRPLLIITSSVRESFAVHTFLQEHGYPVQLLNDVKNIDAAGVERHEGEIIDRAGHASMITVATSVAGRGADITPDQEAIEAGGVHVLMTFLPFNKRVEYQGRGRAGRQGKPGSSEILACLESDLFVKNLPRDLQEVLHAVVAEYGHDSKELQMAFEFIRKCNGLLASQLRVVNLEKDELINEALQTYFTKISQVSGKIHHSNSALRGEPRELSSFIVSSFLGDTWVSEFDYVDAVIRNDDIVSIRRSSQPEDNVVTIDIQPAVHRKIQAAFHRSFGVSIDEVMNLRDVRFIMIVTMLWKYYRSRLEDVQRRVMQFDRSHVSQMVRALQDKVDAAARTCEEKFTGATVTDIKDFLERRKNK